MQRLILIVPLLILFQANASANEKTTIESLKLPADEGSSECNLSDFGGESREAFDQFDKKLRSAATSGNPDEFADLIALPLVIYRDGRTYHIATQSEFMNQVSAVFTPRIRDIITKQSGFFGPRRASCTVRVMCG